MACPVVDFDVLVADAMVPIMLEYVVMILEETKGTMNLSATARV